MRDVERIERVAARHEAEPRAGRAVAERPAHELARERLAFEHVGREIGIRQHHAPEADKVGHAVTQRVLADVRQPLLQVGVRRSDEDHVGEFRLEHRRDANLARDAVQRILGRLVAVGRREERRPDDVRAVVRAAGGQADPADAAGLQDAEERAPVIAVHGRAPPIESAFSTPEPVAIAGGARSRARPVRQPSCDRARCR